jgi:uncharacterized repeat protein (TIGR01451 family)
MGWTQHLLQRVAFLVSMCLLLFAAPAFAQADFSDAPAAYGSASHTIVAGVRIGATVDDEVASLPSANANGDDTSNIDDEDGVSFGTLQRGAIAVITVTVSGAGGFLQGWIDWNGDGDWADAGEQIATDIQDGGTRDFDGAANGQIRLNALVPASASTSNAYARFRWSTTSGLTSTASATDGEVEDYRPSILTEGATPTLNGCIGPSVSAHAPTITTPTATTSPMNGTLTTGALSGTFSSTFSTNGFGGVSVSASNKGVQFDMANGPGVFPDSYQFSYTVTPGTGAGVNQVIVCQSPYPVLNPTNTAGSDIGNDEPNEMTLTWSAGGTAVIHDPDNQISSHANGATITSGTKLIFANSVPNGPGTNGNGLSGPDTWAVIVTAPGGASPFTVTVNSVGCQTSLPSNFCHLMNTTSNTSGDRFREWISFDSRLAGRRTVLNLTKSSSVFTNPVETINHKAIPGATIRYCILVTNPGPSAAASVNVADPLPAALTYVPGSLKIGTSCTTGLVAEDDNAVGTDESDPYGASISGTTISATAASLAIGTTIAVVLDTTIN